MSHLPDRIRFGAAYYHEYQPTPRLERDLDLMAAASFSVIRVGESVWSTWEPDNGVFDLEWLAPVLDGAHARGIDVVLGTPTYAAPPWLARLYPEINVERSAGHRMGWGARQEIDYTHPAFLFHAERVNRRILARYADHPAVVGFQVDNEPGNEIIANPQVFQRFVDHLRHEYGTVEALNERWGLTYWSHRLATWADLWTPDGNAQPQYELAWRRFQAALTTDFIGWQADIVREYARDHQFVTTCIAYERPAVDDVAVSERLDVTSGNLYFRMQDHLSLPDTAVTPQTWFGTGTWALFESADRMWASKQAPFLVTETDAQSIVFSWSFETGYDGQWRQAAWAMVARGARMIEYWHWHTLHFGAETYWGGVLPHSLEPGRVYEQVAALGRDLAAAGDAFEGAVPDADVALLYSTETSWMSAKTPFLGDGASGPDHRAYRTVVDAFYRAASDAGLQTRIVHAGQLFDRDPAAVAAETPVLVAAAYLLATDDDLRWLERYAAAGGHLVLGIRTGYEDNLARARTERKPAFLDVAAGVHYDEYSTLSTSLQVTTVSSELSLPVDAAATGWVDGLTIDDATPLVRYVHPHFGRWPAVTTRLHGDGRVTYVGTVPNPDLGRALLEWFGRDLDRTWSRQAPSQTVRTSTTPTGGRLVVVHNWSFEPSTFTLPAAAADVLGPARFEEDDTLELGAWDVRVLRVD
ncbi:beta-galactosidase [Jatrophihabitans sp. YIM 134969]